MNKPPLPTKGFSLIELMVVITIIAILATAGLVIYSKSQEGARVAFTHESLSRLAQAITLYRIHNDEFPPEGPPCPSCLTDNSARADHIRNNLLTTLASPASGEPYIDDIEKFVFDGWGSAITYGVGLPDPENRLVCSYGPNKQWNMGPWAPGSDDICFISSGTAPTPI